VSAMEGKTLQEQSIRLLRLHWSRGLLRVPLEMLLRKLNGITQISRGSFWMAEKQAVLGFGRNASSDGPRSNQYPPPDAARGATADLCDVFLPDPVDVVGVPKVAIVAPIFKCARQRQVPERSYR
jgi:hypothetical protein